MELLLPRWRRLLWWNWMYPRHAFDGATLGVLMANWTGWLPSSAQLANVLTMLSIIYVSIQLVAWFRGKR